MGVAVALVRHACSYFFGVLLSQPIASASLSPSGTWLLLWRDDDTAGKNAHNDWSSPTANQRRGNDLCWTAEESVGQGWEGLGDGRRGYGCGFQRQLKCADNRSRLDDDGRKLTNLQMSEEQLKAFLEAVKADAGLQEKLKAATEPDAVVAIAKAAGFMISAEELKKAQVEVSEVSEEELEGVAGGAEGMCGPAAFVGGFINSGPWGA